VPDLEAVLDPSTLRLIPGTHRASWDDIKQIFVINAPNSNVRADLYGELMKWVEAVQAILPISKFWVNGGFVTHKSQIPEDIDVVAFSPCTSFTVGNKTQLDSLRTQHGPKFGTKNKPIAFGEKIDTYIVPQTISMQVQWGLEWARVRDPETRMEIVGASKGFIVVMP
jgi:hypothetical protein